MDANEVHRVVHGYLLTNGWQRREADSSYYRPTTGGAQIDADFGSALQLQLGYDGINLQLNPQVVVYPPPIELLAGEPGQGPLPPLPDSAYPPDAVALPDNPPAHQPGPTATYPEGSPLAFQPEAPPADG